MCTCAPVASASAMSRATAASSEAAGAPRRPSRVETQPSCMTASWASEGSSQWSITGRPRPFAYSSARRMSVASQTGAPSSEKATQPAAARSPSSASSFPARALLTAPIGRTRTDARASASRRTCSMIERLSIAGSVLGMAQTVVKPPRAAASVPVAMSSLYSRPGSRRCVCRSTKPGVTTSPRASISPTPSAGRSGPTAAIRPSSTSTSAVRSRPEAGSMTRPWRMTTRSVTTPPSRWRGPASCWCV